MQRRWLAAFLTACSWPGVIHAAMSVYLSPDQLCSVAPLVLEGRVERVASGYDPRTGALATYVSLDVSAVHRGPAELAHVVLREPGGSYGGLTNELDAVPVFQNGEQVVVFAEPGRDGVLRTAGMFFGKFTVLSDASGRRRALRDLTGRGLILRRPPEVLEAIPLDDLVGYVRSFPFRGAERSFRETPPELADLLWETRAEFTSLSPTTPARWEESDASIPIGVDIERARNPLGNGVAAVAEVERALAAWTGVPEARVVLRAANTDARFTATSSLSPADSYPPANIVLFGDPYDDLADPVGCGGVLAIGGYWRSMTPGRTVNGVRFYPTRRLYVVFNRNFECFLSDPRNLAEVATHELGHGLGFGHSDARDSVMRAWAYGGRGAVLGDDDRDAAHCVYPHALSVVSPNGREAWAAGSVHTVVWRSSSEAGGDPGTVSLDYSADDGATWSPIAAVEPNDGSALWTLPALTTTRARIRVLQRTRAGAPPAPFPPICSQDASDAAFSVVVTSGRRDPTSPTTRSRRSSTAPAAPTR